MKKVLIIATSRKTRGGITSVIKAHETGEQWKKYHCRWIQTHRDGNPIRKLWYLTTALLEYLVLLPFYDIVHIHLTAGNSVKRKRIFFDLAKCFRKKTIIHFHPSGEQIFESKLNCKHLQSIFNEANLVLVLSPHWKKLLEQRLHITTDIQILFNPCPQVVRRSDLRKEQILFAGTIIKRKGYDTLLQGFAKIAPKHPKWEIVFAGNGEIDCAKEIAKKNHIENQVFFLGWVNGKEKEKAFQQASIYCLASYGEGFPMGVLDAWAYGIPCIVTPVGGLPDIVIEGKNALTFNPGDTEALAKQLEKMITNNKLREEIGKESLKLTQTTFNIDTINEQLDKIYSML